MCSTEADYCRADSEQKGSVIHNRYAVCRLKELKKKVNNKN
ncbi:hypothetical protein HMPREF9420_2050 [Segatella salivae DSM 15606]|uniref:Uncharacterized protein n=1 Tax=Segatella salivae DSM 15606 TaxID=888832 RepID=E6MRD2_9BACT|nr:hypothetical protein HMPREF9420_2050 [Segatella salivae DSM 15606]